MSCPAESEMLEFVEGTLSGPASDALHLHLDGCESCQRLVAELARVEDTLVSGLAADGSEPRPLQRGDSLDRYIVLERLGVGGMGVVYAAFDPQLDRKVALKLLRPDARGPTDEHRARLLHEAQALARLSHPHVVTVYEAKPVGEQLFVAMELVDGTTAAQWLESVPRPWHEVLDVFLKAGQGLLAAHEAGLVHRDFKPANVLIGKDGRVRVTDFGLARLEEREDSSRMPLEETPPGHEESLTRTGAMVGTPAYMAPEQWDRQPADARSDQFSFCVALYEGLYGSRPFQGEGLQALGEAVRLGEVPPAPRRSKVPHRVRRVLLRGLEVEPHARYPSMRELLAELDRHPLSAGRVALVAAAAGVLLALGAVIGNQRVDPRELVCRGAERHLADIWDDGRKEQVRSALLSTDTPYAQDAWRTVERALDTYAQSWVSMHTDSCEATRVRGERSEALMDLQMMCLERHARDLKALTDLFIRTQGQSVANAAQAAYALPSLRECAETDALAAQVKRPKEPALLAKVEAVDHQLSEVRALAAANKHVPALEKAEAVAELARGLDHAPTRAEAFYQLGVLRMRTGEARQAQEALLEAAWAAQAGHHDRLAARARIDLIYVIGELFGRPEDAQLALREAQAAISRVGADPEIESALESSHGSLLTFQYKCEDARPHLRRALELADKAYKLNAMHRAHILDNLSRALRCVGDLQRARDRAKEALALRENTLGPMHPEVAISLNNLANVLQDETGPASALPVHQRALEIREQTLGPNTIPVADSLLNVGGDLTLLDLHTESRKYMLRALAIYEAVLGPESPRLARPLLNLGHVEEKLHEPGEAVKVLERALVLLRGRDDEEVAIARFNLALALRSARKDDARARSLALEARQYLSRRKEARKRDLADIDAFLENRSL
ncbi:MAG TPA: serine/threonine-protein kinase [Longimicrobium sp.]|nr:serine/threonine-protein kinase [Longimicrobium sp.]